MDIKKKFRKEKYSGIYAKNIKELQNENCTLKEQIQIMSIKDAAIDDLLHDARKVNGELKRCIDSLDFDEHPSIEEIWAQANLLSIIFKMYDVQVNTENLSSNEKYFIPLYRRIEKVYKCLDRSHFRKEISIKLNGTSYMEYEATDLIEIAFFIVIENAIKYAPRGSQINIDFSFIGDTQIIIFRNQATLPKTEELQSLTQRSFRGSNARETNGSGLGLHTFQALCENLNIDYEFKVIPEEDCVGEFRVIMRFSGCRNNNR